MGKYSRTHAEILLEFNAIGSCQFTITELAIYYI